MIRLSMVSISILIALVVAVPAITQEEMTQEKSGGTQSGGGGEVLGTVVRGNTTIVFEPADTRDIDTGQLRTWGEFAERHPKIANALAYKPSLIDDGAYLKKHPALEAFFQAHPDVKGAMTENSGNFVAIPPWPGE